MEIAEQWENANAGKRQNVAQDLTPDWETIDQLLLTIPEVGRVLSVSRTTVYQLIGDGHLPSVKIGTSRRIRREDLAAYVDGLQWAS